MMADVPASLLPHRAPFLFVTRVLNVQGERAQTEWDVAGGEDWLRGHFPGHPIVPGVLLGEALAQTAGIALGSCLARTCTHGQVGFLAKLDLRFHAAVTPPATIRLEAARTGHMGQLHQFDVSAVCNGARAAHGTLVLAVPDEPAAQTATPR